MKKILILTVSIITLLAGILLAVPYFFKDKIQAKVNEEIAKKINAKVYYNEFDISLIKQFPKLTLSLSDFGIVGHAPFRADTLVQAKEFSVSVDVKSILSGGKIDVHAVALESPKILIKTLRDGSANYDIYKTDSLEVQKEESKENSNFKVNIQSWKINNGQIIYDDRLKDAYVSLKNITHEGSGDINADVYDLVTQTDIENATIEYGGTNYISNKMLSAEMKLNIDQAHKKYTFKDNVFKINDLVLNLAGFVSMPDTSNIVMDLTYSSPENTFKNLLSLVPNIYTDKFKDLNADGLVVIGGIIKGTKNATKFPSFSSTIEIHKGMFQYAEMPTAVKDININLNIQNFTDNLNNTEINFSSLNLKFGENPVKGKILIKGLQKSLVDADLVAKLDLHQISQIFPMKGLEMKGLYDINLKAKGTYDTLTKQFPQVNAAMSLSNGFIKSDKFPEPIQNLNLKATLLNTDGALASTKLDIADLRMVLDGEPFTANGTVQNFENYNWDIKAKGKLDLTKITKIYPLTDMTLKGIIDADIATKGKMADVQAKRYANLPTTGKAKVQGIEFASKEYPQGIKVTTADMTFTPQSINVSNSNGYLGKSDFTASGTFSNYIGYVLNNEVLKGKVKLKSQKFNVNEWMKSNPTPTNGATNPSNLEVVEIPKNIDFVMDSEIGEVLYDNMKMNNIKGALTVGGGAVKMQNVAFQSLGGSFITNGTYNSADLAHPKFDFALNLDNVEIAQAYQQLNIVKYLMPIAQYLIGGVNSKLKINGELGQDMMPKINTLSGDGLMKILKGEISQDNPLVQKLVETTKLSKLKDTKLNNLLMQFEIVDGTFGIKPFDIKFDDYKITASGRHGLVGSMDYALVLDVPAGKTGEAFSSIFQKWTGKALQGTDRVKFDLSLGGTVKNPIFGFKGSSTANSLKDAVVAEAKSQIDAAKAKALEEADRLKKEAEAKLQVEKDKILSEANAKKAEIEARVQREKAAIEAKAKATVDSIKKAAADRAKRILDEQKKSVLDGLFKKNKADTTKNIKRAFKN
ncbi:AsmA-like protein [Arcicella aurantiaca]|uniref:AsmA-like protein n=1 Tax=Arcicella aurantiaca TaxID=591202 RepID=A0A316DVH4_9BACT|nr:AsmA family protein [Arcicella aurantiaca]PWK22104.1 AsmA-like protein [Arcicella aurantiaca]